MADQSHALAWHRECSECGIALTVAVSNLETGEPVPQPAPENVPCEVCKNETPGPWIAGHYDDPFEDDDDPAAEEDQ